MKNNGAFAKPGRIFSPERRAVRSKAQVRARYALQDKAIEEFRAYLDEEFELYGSQAMILAKEIVPEAIKRFVDQVSPSAPSVFLSDNSILESMMMDSRMISQEWNEQGRLESILEEYEEHEEREKHDF